VRLSQDFGAKAQRVISSGFYGFPETNAIDSNSEFASFILPGKIARSRNARDTLIYSGCFKFSPIPADPFSNRSKKQKQICRFSENGKFLRLTERGSSIRAERKDIVLSGNRSRPPCPQFNWDTFVSPEGMILSGFHTGKGGVAQKT
jgi:hypothetical protein